MKKIYIIIAAVLFLASCKEEDLSKEYNAGKFEYVGINTSPLPSTLPEGNGTASSSVNISVRYGNDVKPGRDIVVNIGLSGSGVLGTDFNITGVNSLTANGFSVTIPADTSVVSFILTTITNTDTQDDRTVIMQVASASPEVSLGFPYSARYNLTIADDDCPYDLEADFSGPSEAYENSVDLFGEFGPYDANVTYVDETTLSVGNVFDFGWEVLVTLDPLDNSLTVEPQGPYAGLSCGAPIVDWMISGTGSLSPCTNSFSLDLMVESELGCGTGFAFQLLMDVGF